MPENLYLSSMTDDFRLPPIDLSELPERTKDYLLAVCNTTPGMTPKEAIKSVLDNAAADYMPRPQVAKAAVSSIPAAA